MTLACMRADMAGRSPLSPNHSACECAAPAPSRPAPRLRERTDAEDGCSSLGAVRRDAPASRSEALDSHPLPFNELLADIAGTDTLRIEPPPDAPEPERSFSRDPTRAKN